LQQANGEPLVDIRTQANNQAMADGITEWIRSFTADPETAMHVSIAGARKTMGFYAGYALSLYSRSQDRLSLPIAVKH
jgi:CRISPR-associated protein (TIGR02584 family)